MGGDFMEDRLLDWEIADRFGSERHPEQLVDGDDPYDRDLLEEGDDQ